jgi:hypothetical protein
MRRLARLLAVLVVAWVFWRPEPAAALICRGGNSPEYHFYQSSVVFLGRVAAKSVAVDPYSVDETITLEVQHSWKGTLPETVTGHYRSSPNVGGDHPSRLMEGEIYIIYGRARGNLIGLDSCSRIMATDAASWHDRLMLTAWDLRVAGPVLIGLILLLRRLTNQERGYSSVGGAA